jgi:glycerol kinase
LGAAYLAGLTTGFWKSRDEVGTRWDRDVIFEPKMETEKRNKLIQTWHKAVERSRGWDK